MRFSSMLAGRAALACALHAMRASSCVRLIAPHPIPTHSMRHGGVPTQAAPQYFVIAPPLARHAAILSVIDAMSLSEEGYFAARRYCQQVCRTRKASFATWHM